MKKINLLIAALAFVGLTSCDYDGSDDAKVTKYVTIELTGGNQTLVPVGSEYTDPGYTATEGTEDVTSKVVVSGDQVDPDKVGIYNVTYSAKNVDGFAAEVTRTVLVYDPAITTDITGTYTVEKGEDLYPHPARTGPLLHQRLVGRPLRQDRWLRQRILRYGLLPAQCRQYHYRHFGFDALG